MTKRKPTTSTDKAPEPMDSTIREQAVGMMATNTQRVCWAIKTLVAEVTELFPETPVEYSNYDGRNTALDVTFDLTALGEPDRSDFKTLLLSLPVEEHRRVAGVEVDDALVLVSIKPGPRTQDVREPFALADAWTLLTEDDEPFESNPADMPSWVDEAADFPEGGSL